jgi:hypothetical protein
VGGLRGQELLEASFNSLAPALQTPYTLKISFRRLVTLYLCTKSTCVHLTGKAADTMFLKKLWGKRSGKRKDYGPEKRDLVRLVYPPDKRPILTVGKNSFEVLNICETGLKFLNHMEKPFGKQVFGNISFQNGGSLKINGSIRWEGGREIGLFVSRIPAFVIKQEIRAFIRQEASEDTIISGATLEAAKQELGLEDD